MKRRLRVRARDHHGNYWHLANTYPDSAREYDDILCPHGKPTDMLRATGVRLTQVDLQEWVDERADEYLDNWCRYGH